jgi:hypothetical protein
MKKFVLLPFLFVMIFMNGSLFAQETNGSGTHLFHFGLKVSPALSWFAPGDKTFTNDGSRLGFGYGLITEFGFSKNYAFSTGLEILNAGGKLGFPDSTLYTLPDVAHPKLTDTFLLKRRTYKLRYVDIPLLLKLKTNAIGSMTYFGQFGIDAAILWQATANDNVDGITPTNSDVDISKDINFIRLALNVGLGAELNLSGSTSLVFSINYNNGFTNALRKKSKMLYNKNFDTHLVQTAVFNYVGLTVGVLF